MKVTENQREEFFGVTGRYGSDEEIKKFYEASSISIDSLKSTGFSPIKEDPLTVQVGGDHYSAQKIQPIEYIFQNNLGFCEGNVVKYVTRYKEKNGIQDLEKARHYLDLLINQLSKENNGH